MAPAVATRLTSAHQGRVTSQQSVTTNTYNGDGKRVTLTESTHTTITYVYDSNRGLPVVLQDGLHKNVWGLGLAYTVSMDGQNTVQVPHTNGLGSVRALTDSTGTVVEDYQTDAFGVPVATDGPNYTQRFQYSGEQRDYDGLIYLRARFYEPVLGRFMGRDPYGGNPGAPLSLNRFSYVANNPVTGADPSGLAVATDSAGGGPTDGGSQVKDDGSQDGLMCDTPPDTLGLYKLNVTCTPPQVLGQVPVVVVTPWGTYTIPSVFAASPIPPGGGGKQGGTPKSNVAQNKQFRDAVREAERRLSRRLTFDEVRRLHDAIPGQNYSYEEIVDEAVNMFGN